MQIKREFSTPRETSVLLKFSRETTLPSEQGTIEESSVIFTAQSANGGLLTWPIDPELCATKLIKTPTKRDIHTQTQTLVNK